MAKEFTKGFYTSKVWRECRKAYIKSVGGLCEECLKKGIYRAGKIVHHIVPITPNNIDDPTITLSHNNLIFVCHDCHEEKHKTKKYDRYLFLENGEISPPIIKKF